MAEYAPLFKHGFDVTYTASADVTGGQVVEVTGDRVVAATTAASTKVIGVALYDAKTGDLVTITDGGVQRPTASGAIAAGDRVASAAAGKVSTATTNTIGTAIASAVDGAVALIKFDA